MGISKKNIAGFLALFLAGIFLFASCGKKKTKRYTPPQRKFFKKKKKVVKKKTVEKYVYKGYKNRNPFFMSGAGAPRTTFKQTESSQQESAGFQLNGIMTDLNGVKYALLSDASGGSYILKNGWLYDAEGKKVPSVTGTVFENRIIIISGKQIKELKLPEEDDTGKLE